MNEHPLDAGSGQRRVFKKSSPSNDLTVYLPKRDFYDHHSSVDRVDGMLTYEPRLGRERKVFGKLVVILKYSDDSSDSLGPILEKELHSSIQCIYPATQDRNRWSSVQKKLSAKLNDRGYAFTFKIPENLPNSVALYQPLADNHSQHGVEYKIHFFVADDEFSPHFKESSVILGIRKLSYEPVQQSLRKPSAEVEKRNMIGSGRLYVSSELDKEVYYHGDDLVIGLNVDNMSSRVVKSITVSVKQQVFLRLENDGSSFSSLSKTYPALLETKTGCPIKQGMQSAFSYKMKLSYDESKIQKNTALNWHVRGADSQLAASTMLLLDKDHCREGLSVAYMVKIKLSLTGMGGDVVLKMPFILANHPPPKKERSSPAKPPVEKQASAGTLSAIAAAEADILRSNARHAMPFGEVEEEDDDDGELDLVFEEFVRGRADKFFRHE